MTVVQIANVKSQLQKISSLINALSTTQNNVEIIGSLVENELQSMDKAIEETVARIQVLIISIFVRDEQNKSMERNEWFIFTQFIFNRICWINHARRIRV